MSLIAKGLKYFCIILLLIMTIVVTMQIAYRYFLGDPLMWSQEVTRYLFVYLIFIGAAVGIREGMHVAVDILVEYTKGVTKKTISSVINTLNLVFMIFVLYYGTSLVISTYSQSSPTLGIPMGLAYAAIPIGAVFSILFLIEQYVVIRKEIE